MPWNRRHLLTLEELSRGEIEHIHAVARAFKRIGLACGRAWEVLVRGGPVTVLEGAWQPSRIVVLKFPSREAAEGFYRSATYQQGRLLRQGAADVKMIIVEGFVPA